MISYFKKKLNEVRNQSVLISSIQILAIVLTVASIVFYISESKKYQSGFFWDIEVYEKTLHLERLNLDPYLTIIPQEKYYDLSVTELMAFLKRDYVVYPFSYLPMFVVAGKAVNTLTGGYFIELIKGLTLISVLVLIFGGYRLSRSKSLLVYIGLGISTLSIVILGLFSGNLILWFYAMLCLALISKHNKNRWICIAIIVGTIFKFQMGLFFIIPLFIYGITLELILSGVVVVLAYLSNMLFFPELFQRWVEVVFRYDSIDVGFGFLGVLFQFSWKYKIDVGMSLKIGGFLLFLSVFLFLLYKFAQKNKTKESTTLILVLFSILLLPRIKSYDLFLISPILIYCYYSKELILTRLQTTLILILTYLIPFTYSLLRYFGHTYQTFGAINYRWVYVILILMMFSHVLIQNMKTEKLNK